jgi:glycosyltransferase involved in cell wall biosynthesis
MDISFVLPAHNEELLIAESVGSIHRAMRELNATGCAIGERGESLSYEVIVAADGCTDGTVAIARAAGAIIVEHDRRQIAATRNLGAQRASGEVFFFVDADTFVNETNIREALAAMDAGAAGGGAPMQLDGELSWHIRLFVPTLMWMFRVFKLTGGAFFFCTRAAFTASGGWNEQYFASEEIHLAREIKTHGPFMINRSVVTTSGRKARAYSGWQIWGLILTISLRPSMLKDRSRMWLWYDPR